MVRELGIINVPIKLCCFSLSPYLPSPKLDANPTLNQATYPRQTNQQGFHKISTANPGRCC